jgi:hypothetical protein
MSDIRTSFPTAGPGLGDLVASVVADGSMDQVSDRGLPCLKDP